MKRTGVRGLGPIAVLPLWQRQGIGTFLVTCGLEHCRDAGYGAVAVLGHPAGAGDAEFFDRIPG